MRSSSSSILHLCLLLLFTSSSLLASFVTGEALRHLLSLRGAPVFKGPVPPPPGREPQEPPQRLARLSPSSWWSVLAELCGGGRIRRTKPCGFSTCVQSAELREELNSFGRRVPCACMSRPQHRTGAGDNARPAGAQRRCFLHLHSELSACRRGAARGRAPSPRHAGCARAEAGAPREGAPEPQAPRTPPRGR